MCIFRPQLPQLGLYPKYEFPKIHTKHFSISPASSVKVVCGLRNRPRKPLWRSRVLSTEAIQAVHSIKLAAATPNKLEQIFKDQVSRLLKRDLLDALTELQRQNEVDLAVKVFNHARKEVWYVPDLSMYNDMLLLLGKNKLIEMVELLFHELKKEGLKPNTRTYTEVMGAYFKVGMVEKGIETYELLKESGCVPDKLALQIMLRNLKDTKLEERLKRECEEYLDFPQKFLEESQRKYPKRMSLPII
ncbi:unnamed protein product [Cuscuta europaea]|uniref:Pentatricopeptide repeat-containing protein n=2 Tax=Cuscuta europaea TaxID=41803 RepID=A0A9P0YZ82_CUSEU|nr:unnamed protein product [Cuscuta europaea]